MKKILLATGLVAGLQVACAAQKVEKYCELIATQRLMSTKVNIDLNFGEERKFFSFKNTQVKDELGRVRKFNSVVDALNYMGAQHWTFINAFPVSNGNGAATYHFFFRKEFDASELESTNMPADER